MDREGEHTHITFRTNRERRLVFLLVFAGILSLTYGLFYAFDFLPERPDTSMNEPVMEAQSEGYSDEAPIEPQSSEAVPAASTDERVVSAEREAAVVRDESPDTTDVRALSTDDIYPIKITFDAIDNRTVTVLNPTSRDAAVLDAELLKGVVRHPDSADFERTGTIFLFGHSSYLPNVINKNFQAFNGIQKMDWGDIVRLSSHSREYVYRVDRVYEVSAQDAEVKIETGKAKLTLVTCDSFGAKSDRFVVEATLIDTVALGG